MKGIVREINLERSLQARKMPLPKKEPPTTDAYANPPLPPVAMVLIASLVLR